VEPMTSTGTRMHVTVSPSFMDLLKRARAGKGGPSTVDDCRILRRSLKIQAARQAYGEAHMELFTRGVLQDAAPLAREPSRRTGAATIRSRPRPPPG
jgi:hypothetical protein